MLTNCKSNNCDFPVIFPRKLMAIMRDKDNTNGARFFRPWNCAQGAPAGRREDEECFSSSSGETSEEDNELREKAGNFENRHLDLLKELVNQTHIDEKEKKSNTKREKQGRAFPENSLGPSAFSPVSTAKNAYFSDFPSCLMPPQFCYNNSGFGSESLMALAHGGYTTVEEAVKLIHRQDFAAKQMKKLRPKKFRCEHCNVAFSNNGQLKGHVRIHTGERPFKCDAEGCGKSFTRNEELTRHRRIHTGIRPHSCAVCNKRFGRKDHLKKHLRTHESRPCVIAASAMNPFISPFSYLPATAYPYPIL